MIGVIIGSFIRKVLEYVWKYGRNAIAKVIDWARRNWPTVKKWIERGIPIATIIEMILRILGLI